MPQTIALVDDDRNILTSVSMTLEAEGYAVRTYTDGAEALRALVQNPVDLAILDIKKPFSQRLLIERIRAILRRELLAREAGAPGTPGAPGAAAPTAAAGESGEVLVRGELTLDSDRHLCTWKGSAVDLTVTEFLLLKSLAARPGHVKNRDQLMDAAYGEHIYVDDRTIDSHIKRLRKKFKAMDPEFAQIETLYGVGYRYRDRPGAAA